MAMTAPIDLVPHTRAPSRPPRVVRTDSTPPGLVINGVAAALIGIALIVALVGFGGGAAANDPLRPASSRSAVVDTIEIYVVQPGDTLWSIAGRVTPAGADLRPTVDHLSEVAGGAALQVGQRIVIDHAAIGG